MERRQELEKLSFKELQSETRKYGLKPPHSRDGCIDLLMGLFEGSVQTHSQQLTSTTNQQMSQDSASNMDTPDPQEPSTSRNQVTSVPIAGLNLPDQPFNPTEDSFYPSASQTFIPSKDPSKTVQPDSVALLCSLVSEQMKQQQQLMQILSSFASTRLSQQDQSHISPLPPVSHRSNYDGSDFSATTKISVNTVNLLASQLPEFSGKEDDDVVIWIQKVERVARIHGASQEMMLLAATGKLVKSNYNEESRSQKMEFPSRIFQRLRFRKAFIYAESKTL